MPFAACLNFLKTDTLGFIINGGGGQNERGGFKDFEKLINGGVKISGGGGQDVGQNIEEKKRKQDYPYYLC